MNSSTPVVVAWWSLQTKCLVLTAAGILCGPVFPLNWPSDQHSSVQNGNPSCFGTSLLFQLLDSSSGPVLYSFSPPNVWETNYWRGAILVDWRRNEGWRSEGVFLLHVTYDVIILPLSMMTITMNNTKSIPNTHITRNTNNKTTEDDDDDDDDEKEWR